MADERLLRAIRRFSGSKEQVQAAYEAVFQAYHARLESVTVVIGKTSGEDSASGQVVVSGGDYLAWMDCLEQRMQELEAEESGEGQVNAGTQHVDLQHRYLRT